MAFVSTSGLKRAELSHVNCHENNSNTLSSKGISAVLKLSGDFMTLLTMIGLLSLWAVAQAQYSPELYIVPAAERSLRSALANAVDDEARFEIARTALQEYPDDISLGRIAQDALLPLLAESTVWFKDRAERLKTRTADYLYARAANDGAISSAIADALLARDPNDYWGWRLKAVAVSAGGLDSLPAVAKLMERAVKSSPNRPDTYLYLGFYYQQLGEDEKAIAAFEAGAIADPTDKTIRDFRLTHYATHKQSEKYFALVPTALPNAPLELDVTLAKSGRKLSKEVFTGHYSVIECWTYL
jgi:tetratricopeptide (TPR) repeat protein